jgi:leucyl/phenylalanyl-tRNA--protein transferase
MKLFAAHRHHFPDPELAFSGLVDMSDDLSVERLLEAYSFGIFPWPQGDLPTLWFCPEERGVLEFAELHVPRSLEKLRQKDPFHFTFDQAFEEVMQRCARQPRPEQDGTWITPKLLQAYAEFHRAGYAHSLEAWQGGQLVGGLYGVYAAGCFSGESMFFQTPGASKLALLRLIDFLREQGLEWMDIQMVTPLSQRFGGKYISRHAFLEKLRVSKSRAKKLHFKI